MLKLALLEAAAARGDLERHELALFEPIALDALEAPGAVGHCRSCTSGACLGVEPGPGSHCTGCVAGARSCPGAEPSFEPPKAVRLFRFGENPTTKGVFRLEAGATRALESARTYGNEYPFDYCHAMVAPPVGADPAEAGKAAGWFVLEPRDDGLYARVKRWTETAHRYLASGEYKYTSPAFYADKNGNVVAIINVALTNIPSTHNLAPLAAHQNPDAEAPPPASTEAQNAGPEVFSMKGILSLLSLAADATEGEAVAALSTKLTESTRAAESAKAETKQVLDALGAQSVPAALGTVAGLKDAADKGKVAIEALAQRAEEDKAAAKSAAEAAVKALLDAAEKSDGKGVKLTPGGRKAFEQVALSLGPDGVKAYLDAKGYEVVTTEDRPATQAAAPAATSAGAPGAPAAAIAPAGSPPKLLSKWEDYDAEPNGWRELERLSAEHPDAFERLHADYRARTGPSISV